MPDPDRDSFIDVTVKPAAQLDRLDEVLVITSIAPHVSAEQQQDQATSEVLKGAEAAAIKEQRKASQIMAEHLPGLNDPNAPATGAVPPGQDHAAPPAAPSIPKLLQPLRPDRFTPGASSQPTRDQETSPPARQENKPETKPKSKPVSKPLQQANSSPAHAGRNP
jgi:rod shape-determining protein MreC